MFRESNLKHWGFKKDHKYVARIETGDPKNKYRYFYTMPEYKAYLNGKNKVNSKSNKVLNAIKKISKQPLSKLNNLINKGKNFTKNFSDTMTVDRKSVDKKVAYNVLDKYGIKSFVNTIKENLFNGPFVKLAPYNKFKSMDEMPKKIDTYNDEEDQAVTNPKYDPNSYAYSNNCAYCTAAYELRQRGYDVEASPVTIDTRNTLDVVASWYKDPDIYSFETSKGKSGAEKEEYIKNIEDEILKNGEGSRGQYCVYWNNGGGHSMAWEVTNGEVIIRDCQTNQTVDIEEYYDYIDIGYFFRTDNLELNDSILKTVKQRY